jgi:hypothetical protein
MLRTMYLGLALTAALAANGGCSWCHKSCTSSSASPCCAPPCCPQQPCCDGAPGAGVATQAYSVPGTPGCCR